jgi:hypothetical protein
VTDRERKNGGAEDEDVTRPATRAPSAPADAAAGTNVSPARDGDPVDVAPRRAPAALKRLAPQEGEGEVVALSADGYLLGRSQGCNIQLRSATASRQHARIELRNGEWFLCPVGGKVVIVEGRPTYDEARLQHAMKIQLGADEFVFLQEESAGGAPEWEGDTLVTPSPPGKPPRASTANRGLSPAAWLAIGAGAVLLAALAFWLLL